MNRITYIYIYIYSKTPLIIIIYIFNSSSIFFNVSFFLCIIIVCTQLYGIKYNNLTQINCTLLYGFKHSYPILIFFKQIYLTPRRDPNKYFLIRVKLGVIVMVMKGCSTLPKTPELEPQYRSRFRVITGHSY